MFLSNSENMWNISFKGYCFWRASGKMVVITQIPDLISVPITPLGNTKTKADVQGTVHLQSQVLLRSPGKKAREGYTLSSKGRTGFELMAGRLDLLPGWGQGLGFTASWGALTVEETGLHVQGLQWWTELPPGPAARKGLPHMAREPCKQEADSVPAGVMPSP